MIITNFASGELSPWLNGRVDLQQYFQSAQKIKNFEIVPTGGLKRRTGTKRLGELSGNCRLIPFIVDQNTSFILEFVPGYIHIWKNGKKQNISIETDYTNLAEINEIQYAQDYDRMIFVHTKYDPLELTYSADGTFTSQNMPFTFYPEVELDDDFDYITIQPNTEDNLPPGHDGQYCLWRGILYIYDSSTAEKWIPDPSVEDPKLEKDLFTSDRKRPGCIAFFNNRLYFAGTIEKRQKIWASAAPDTEKNRYNLFATYKKYITVNKQVKDGDIHLFTGELLMDNISDSQTVITNVSQDLTEALAKDKTLYFVTNNEYIPIGAKVINVTANSVTIDKKATNTEDKKAVVFSMSLWKDAMNPSADDYEYKVVNSNVTTSDCSFNFELASDQNDAIRFMAANKYMAVGTETNIWAIPSGISALSIVAELNGRYGSDLIQGRCLDTAIIFFAQGKCGIREYYYNSQAEAFQTNNIAILADHLITESPAVDFDFVTNPYNRLIITRQDGKVVTMLYDKTNGVFAWNRIEHEKKIVSTAVTRGELQNDLVYFAVKDGTKTVTDEEGNETTTDRYYLELLDSNNEVYLDSYIEATEDTDISQFSSEAVIYDSITDEVKPLLDFDSIIDFEGVYIGYPYESLIKSMPVVADTPERKKRITNLIFRFLDSYMPTLKTEGLPDEYFTDIEQPFTGIKSIDYPGITDREVTFTLSISEPKRCNILSVNANISV